MEATTNRLNSSSSEAFRLVVLFYEEDALTWSDTTAPSSTPYSPHSLIQHCTIQFRDHSGPQCYKECLADGALLRMARRGSNSISPSSPEPPDLQPSDATPQASFRVPLKTASHAKLIVYSNFHCLKCTFFSLLLLFLSRHVVNNHY